MGQVSDPKTPVAWQTVGGIVGQAIFALVRASNTDRAMRLSERLPEVGVDERK